MWGMRKDLHPDSLECTLLDWNVLGCYYGFRLSEWTQNDVSRDGHPLKDIDYEPLAFTFDDFQFSGKRDRHLRQKFTKSLTE